jgi:hypothetical protein
MASEIVVSFASNMMDHVDVEANISSCYNVVNGYEPSSPSLISSTGSTEEPADDAVEYCQCTESDDEAFIECHVWRDGVVVNYLSLFDIVQILELQG